MNNISMVLEIIIIKFSCILKLMSRNTFPEPQPDSASYGDCTFLLVCISQLKGCTRPNTVFLTLS